MMAKYTITPWRTQADLLQVRTQLYSSDADSRRKAVDRVMAWKLRGNLPHAVESTALLVEAILHHTIKANSSFSIRAVYSAAFTRFVTGFCDIGRHKERTLEPSSMLDIAKQIGMPTEFVALRHEATHEEMPGLKRLVSATQQALNWLWTVYWSRLEEAESEEAVEAALAAMRAEVASLLRDFRRARRVALRSNSGSSAGEMGDVATTSARCVEMCKSHRARTSALAEVMVEERLIVPSTRELGSSMDGAYMIWDDLLLSISSTLQAFLPALITSLLHNLTIAIATDPVTDVDKEALAMWLLHVMVKGNFAGAAQCDQEVLLASIVKWCCLHPGHWTQYVGRELLQASDESVQEAWRDLFEASLIRTDTGATEDMPSNAPRFDADVLDRQATEEGAIEAAKGWSRAVIADSLPIGVVR